MKNERGKIRLFENIRLDRAKRLTRLAANVCLAQTFGDIIPLTETASVITFIAGGIFCVVSSVLHNCKHNR